MGSPVSVNPLCRCNKCKSARGESLVGRPGKHWDAPARPVVPSTPQLEILRRRVWNGTPSTHRTEVFGRKMVTLLDDKKTFGEGSTEWREIDTLSEVELQFLAVENAKEGPSESAEDAEPLEESYPWEDD